MNPLRAIMLIGSIGKVWAVSRNARNVYSSISILAYYKLLSDMESGYSNNIQIVRDTPNPTNISEHELKSSASKHRQRVKDIMRNINRESSGY